MKYIIGLAISVLCFLGCGHADFETDNLSRFFVEHESDLTEAIQSEYDKGQHDWLLHIDFQPNDFGSTREEQKIDTIERGRGVFQTDMKLTSDASALVIDQTFSDPKIIGSFKYRHSGYKRALKMVERVFNCKAGGSEKLSRVFILASGGSHGADAVNMFSDALATRCGKRVDFAILADAISQPMLFPMGSMHSLSHDGACIHFYQRGDFFMGQPVDGCTNIKITPSKGHVWTADLALNISKELLQQLNTQTSPWSLRHDGRHFPRLSDYWQEYFHLHPELIYSSMTEDGWSKPQAAREAEEARLIENFTAEWDEINHLDTELKYEVIQRLSYGGNSIKEKVLTKLVEAASPQDHAAALKFLGTNGAVDDNTKKNFLRRIFNANIAPKIEFHVALMVYGQLCKDSFEFSQELGAHLRDPLIIVSAFDPRSFSQGCWYLSNRNRSKLDELWVEMVAFAKEELLSEYLDVRRIMASKIQLFPRDMRPALLEIALADSDEYVNRVAKLAADAE